MTDINTSSGAERFLPKMPEKSYLGDDYSYGYEASDMREYALEAVRAALVTQPAAEPAFQKALDIRMSQGWQLGGNACPVLYTDTINGEQVMRDDLWIATTAGLRGAPTQPGAPAEPDWWFAECGDPDYSRLFAHKSDAFAQISDHGGGTVTPLFAGPPAAPAEVVAPSDDEQLVATLIHCAREVSPTAMTGYDLASLLSRASDRIAALASPAQAPAAPSVGEPVALRKVRELAAKYRPPGDGWLSQTDGLMEQIIAAIGTPPAAPTATEAPSDNRAAFNRAYEQVCNRANSIREIAWRMWQAASIATPAPAVGASTLTAETCSGSPTFDGSAAYEAYLDAAGRASASIEVSDAMVAAYLKANDAYWKRTGDIFSGTRVGKPSEAARESLIAALAAVGASVQPVPESLREALQRIVDWRLPRVMIDGRSCRYGTAYGSNGERDYMRQVAKDALDALATTSSAASEVKP